jgi:WD40 repeat protein
MVTACPEEKVVHCAAYSLLRPQEKARTSMRRLLSYRVILFLLGLTLSTRAMALEASHPLVPDGEVFADMSTLVAQMTRSQPIRAVGLSPDGQTLVTGDQAGTVRLWEVATGRERRRLHGHTGAVWVVRNLERQRLDGHTQAVWGVSFSPDGHILASGGGDQTVHLVSKPRPVSDISTGIHQGQG